MDESDVYLEQRTTHDLKRNSIVSGKTKHARHVDIADSDRSFPAVIIFGFS